MFKSKFPAVTKAFVDKDDGELLDILYQALYVLEDLVQSGNLESERILYHAKLALERAKRVDKDL